ncbi:MAG: indole-3-glycerol phosphate synthase TrpC [Vicinamibacterales bacterium]
MNVAGAPDLLATIVAATRRIVEVRSREVSRDALEGASRRRPAGDAFERALRASAAPRIIAECKRRSPSRGILRQDYEPAEHARAYQDAGAAAISVLTEPTFFDGSPQHLRDVRAAATIPILRKDFIVDEYQLFEAAEWGADAILLIVGALNDVDLRRLLDRAHDLGFACLVEVHDVEELERAVGVGARIIGVNSRNLRTLSVDLSVLDTVAGLLPSGVIAVAESGIRTRTDMDRLSGLGYEAFLVGERLISQADPGAALGELRAAPVP